MKKSFFTDLDSDAELDPEIVARMAEIPWTDPEFGEWMNAHPEYLLAMIEVVNQQTEKEAAEEFSPEKQAELKESTAVFLDEVAKCYVAATYDGVLDRVNEIDPTYLLGEEDLEELKACSAQMDELIDVALDILEPERTRYLTHMITTRDYVRKILAAQ